VALIGRKPSADKREVQATRRNEKQSWLWGEILLAGLLGASLALFVTHPALRTRFDLPELRLVLQTTMTLAGLLVAVLAAARYAVEGRRVDLLLATGFFVTSLSNAAFTIAPRFGGHEIAAPPWSAACMTDHGPSECGEPMWIYGASNTYARYRSPF